MSKWSHNSNVQNNISFLISIMKTTPVPLVFGAVEANQTELKSLC